MGHIGVAMGPNAQRYLDVHTHPTLQCGLVDVHITRTCISNSYFHWILVRSNVTTSGDVYTKAVYLNGLHHTLSSDSDISTFAKSIPVGAYQV